MAERAHPFGQHARHVEMVVVINDDPARRGVIRRAVHHVVRRQDRNAAKVARDAAGRSHAVAAPFRAGGDDDLIRSEFQRLRRRQRAGEIKFRVRVGLDALHPVVPHPRPRRQTRQAALAGNATAGFRRRLGDGHFPSGFQQRRCAFQPGGSGADNEVMLLRSAPDDFRMPATPPFLGDGRVLRAAKRQAVAVHRHADIAADAFADLIQPPVTDFRRQERIGDGGAGGADQVQPPLADGGDHRVRRGETADADNWFRRHRLHEICKGELEPFLRKPAGLAVGGPSGEVHVPEVREVRQRLHHVPAFTVGAEAGGLARLIHRESDGYGPLARRGLSRVLQHFTEEAHPIRKRAAIFVAALIGADRQEMAEDRKIMCGVDIDNVVTRPDRPPRRRLVALAKGADVGLVHRASLNRNFRAQHRQGGWADHRLSGRDVARAHSAMGDLDGGERAMGVDRIGLRGVLRDIAVIPDAVHRVVRHIGIRPNLGDLHRDDAPAALRLHRPQGDGAVRLKMPVAGGVGDGVETVGRGDGADFHRLKQDIVAGIAHGRAFGAGRPLMRGRPILLTEACR